MDEGYKPSRILKHYKTKKEIEKTLKDITTSNNLKNFKDFSKSSFNLAYVRFKLKNKDLVYSVIVNRWHDSVAFMFYESDRLDINKDSLNIIEGFVGSYPNYFIVVEQEDISKFFETLIHSKDETKLRKYFIDRDNKDFWKVYDWFQKKFNKSDAINSGLFDLNRYNENTSLDNEYDSLISIFD